METIQWRMEATPERVRQSNSIRLMLGGAFHASGLIFAFIVYMRYQSAGVLDRNFAGLLAFIYIIELAVWYFFMNNLLKFKEKAYTLSERGIEILELEKNQIKRYQWDDFSSFSSDLRVYDPNQAGENTTSDKWYYLGFKTPSLPDGAYIVMAVDADRTSRVTQALLNKLPEKKYE